MITLRTVVIDDEPLAQELIASYIDKTPYMELVGRFSSAQEAIKTILEDKIDLLFLDINMPQLNGMEFARIVPSHCNIVFATAYEQYAIEGFKVGAIDYLMKPVSYDEFITAANKALNRFELHQQAVAQQNKRDCIIVKSDYKLVQIPLECIEFIEGLKDYVKIHVNYQQQSIISLMGMKALENFLPSDKFIRVHRSYIVGTRHIRIIERNRIIFANHSVPVSDSYRQAFISYINTNSLQPNKNNAETDE